MTDDELPVAATPPIDPQPILPALTNGADGEQVSAKLKKARAQRKPKVKESAEAGGNQPPLPPPLTSPPADDDPFDPEKLRLRGDPLVMGAKRVVLAVPIRKPGKQEFFSVRPGEEWSFDVSLLELKGERETFVVAPDVADLVADEVKPVRLRLAMSRSGAVFFLPVQLPDADGKINSWHQDAAAAVKQAESNWVRMKANMPAGTYDVHVATGNIPLPTWPDMTMKELLKLATKNVITDYDHNVLQRLRGQK